MKKIRHLFLIMASVLIVASCSLAADINGEVTAFGSYVVDTNNFEYGSSLQLTYNPALSNNYYLMIDTTLKYQSENNYSPIRINELYIQGIATPSEDIDFKVGYLNLTWGASDAFSPIDNINPRPFSQSISSSALDEKIPILALNVEWYMNPTWSMEIVYQPEFRPNYTPDYVENLLLGYQLAPLLGVNPQTMQIAVEKERPEVSFTQPIWGIRARGKVGSVDTAFSFLKGYYLSAYPYQTDVTLNSDGSSSVQTKMDYPERSVLGAEFQGEIPGIAGVTFRADFALFIPEQWTNQITIHNTDGTTNFTNVDVFDEIYWKASVGADYTAEDNTYYNLIYLLGTPYEEGKDVSSYLFLRLEKPSSDNKWNPFLNSILSLEDGSMINVIGTDYKPKDNWTVTFSYSISSGPATSMFALAGDTISLNVSYVF
ncbi:MAG: hypothetical protein KBG67_02490 [Candidatus Atribacteria bacterium]|nr:hypothetical protein [Candidatus Atribacteria bacterium]